MLRQRHKELEEERETALKELLEQLDEDESPPNRTLGETLKELFYFGKGKQVFCNSQAGKVTGVPVAPERDFGTP